MRYKAQVINALDGIDGTRSKLDIASSHGDMGNVVIFIDQLKEQLEGLRSMINVEPDDLSQHFEPRK